MILIFSISSQNDNFLSERKENEELEGLFSFSSFLLKLYFYVVAVCPALEAILSFVSTVVYMSCDSCMTVTVDIIGLIFIQTKLLRPVDRADGLCSLTELTVKMRHLKCKCSAYTDRAVESNLN